MAVRDVYDTVKSMLLVDERVANLAGEVAAQARGMREELGEIHREQRELRDRVSRIEGGFAVIGQQLRLGSK